MVSGSMPVPAPDEHVWWNGLRSGTTSRPAPASDLTSPNGTLMFAILNMWTTCGRSKQSSPELRVDS